MTPEQAVEILRFALAAIWTEIEHEGEEAPWNAQIIAREGLELTKQFAKKGKDLRNQDIGLESWRRHRELNSL